MASKITDKAVLHVGVYAQSEIRAFYAYEEEASTRARASERVRETDQEEFKERRGFTEALCVGWDPIARCKPIRDG